MDIGCLEVVVHRKSSPIINISNVLLLVLAVVFVFGGLLGGFWPALIPGIAAGVGAFFANRMKDVDYEYAYVEKELRIARIMQKSSRKELGKYDLDKMEICAPTGSEKLQRLSHREFKVRNYSSGLADHATYELIVGDEKLILEPGDELLKVLRSTFPQKVFLN